MPSKASVILSSGDVFDVGDVWISKEWSQVPWRVATSASEREMRIESEIIEAALAAS